MVWLAVVPFWGVKLGMFPEPGLAGNPVTDGEDELTVQLNAVPVTEDVRFAAVVPCPEQTVWV
jgi:hypothetical protein